MITIRQTLIVPRRKPLRTSSSNSPSRDRNSLLNELLDHLWIYAYTIPWLISSAVYEIRLRMENVFQRIEK